MPYLMLSPAAAQRLSQLPPDRRRAYTTDALPPRRRRYTRNFAEAGVMGVSQPSEADPDLLDVLREHDDRLASCEQAIALMAGGEGATEDETAVATMPNLGSNMQVQGATDQGEMDPDQQQMDRKRRSKDAEAIGKLLEYGKQNAYTPDRMRRHWIEQGQQTNSLIDDIRRRNSKFWKVN